MSPNSYVADLRAERDALRAVVARVEGLAAELEQVQLPLPWLQLRRRGRGDAWVKAQDVAHRLRKALGSTDSDPAATERQGEAEGAGDGV